MQPGNFLINGIFIYIIIYDTVMTKEKKLTSVKVEEELFNRFKEECVRSKFSFQKLADRAIFLYLTSEEFKKTIHNQTTLVLKK